VAEPFFSRINDRIDSLGLRQACQHWKGTSDPCRGPSPFLRQTGGRQRLTMEVTPPHPLPHLHPASWQPPSPLWGFLRLQLCSILSGLSHSLLHSLFFRWLLARGAYVLCFSFLRLLGPDALGSVAPQQNMTLVAPGLQDDSPRYKGLLLELRPSALPRPLGGCHPIMCVLVSVSFSGGKVLLEYDPP
jgi:hypothetical protein